MNINYIRQQWLVELSLSLLDKPCTRVRITHGKRGIRVRAIEARLYIFQKVGFDISHNSSPKDSLHEMPKYK